MRPIAAAVLFVALAHPLMAERPELVPAAADSSTPVAARFLWRACGSAPVITRTLEGRRITIDVASSGGGGCFEGPIPTLNIDLGVLPPGIYDVGVHGAGTPSDRAELVVHSVASIVPLPWGAPAAGETQVTVTAANGNGFDGHAIRVLFGGVPGRVVGQGAFSISAVAPPHEPGLVPIEVVLEDATLRRTTVTAPDAFLYYDETNGPDRRIFEPVLFPVSADIDGAFGTRWHSTNRVSGGGYRSPLDLRNGSELANTNAPWGQTLWLARGETNPRFSSTLREDRTGVFVQMPVARERGFGSSPPPFPVRRNSRTVARVWALDAIDGATRIGISAVADRTRFKDVPLVFTHDRLQLPFASADLTAALGSFEDDEEVSVSILTDESPLSKYWLMLSITDNATQHVTVVSSQ